MSDSVFLRLSDRDIRKVLRELDAEDLGWFMLDEPAAVKDAIIRNFSKRDLESFRCAEEVIGRDNIERLTEGRERVLRVVQALAEQGEITLS